MTEHLTTTRNQICGILWLQIALFSMIFHAAHSGTAAQIAEIGMMIGAAGMFLSVVTQLGGLVNRIKQNFV